jgi:hypothetical protein
MGGRFQRNTQSALEEVKSRGKDVSLILEAMKTQGRDQIGEAFRDVSRQIMSMPLVIDYYMPLKSGAQLGCCVINPLAFNKSAKEREDVIELYSEVISGNRLDLWIKRQNTLSMLMIADRECVAFEERIAALSKPT